MKKYMITGLLCLSIIFCIDSYAVETKIGAGSAVGNVVAGLDLLDLDEPLHEGKRQKLRNGMESSLGSSGEEGVEPLDISAESEDVFIKTYDAVNYVKSEGPAETDGYDSKGINIVKYYTMKDSLSGSSLLMSYYITKDATNKIEIVDEQFTNGYKLVSWFTSNDSWLPSNDEDFGLVGDHHNGLYSGTGAEKLIIENDKTLHLIYELEPVQRSVTVKKFIRNRLGEERVETAEINTEFTDSYNAELTGCKLLSAKLYEEPVDVQSWEQLAETGLDIGFVDDDNIRLTDSARALYLLYQEADYEPLHLYANELSYRYSLSDLTGHNLFKIYNYVPSALEGRAFSPECNGHKCSDSSCDKLHYCTKEFKYLEVGSNFIKEHFVDNYNYDINTSFIRDFKQLDSGEKKEFVSWKGGYTDSLEPDAEFTIYRQKSRDKVTLYPNLNNNLTSELYKIGLDVNNDSSYKPLNHREAQSTYTEEQFTNTFSTHFEPAYDRVTEVKWVWELISPYDRETARDSYKMDYAVGHAPSDANSYYSREGNVITHYFLGSENSGLEEVSEPLQEIIEGEGAVYGTVRNKDLKFYPYVAMKYMSKDRTVSDVYVLSENASTVATYDNSNCVAVKIPVKGKGLQFMDKSLMRSEKADTVEVDNSAETEIEESAEIKETAKNDDNLGETVYDMSEFEPAKNDIWDIVGNNAVVEDVVDFSKLLKVRPKANVIDITMIALPLSSVNNQEEADKQGVDMDYDASIDRKVNADLYKKHINYDFAEFILSDLNHIKYYKVCLDNDKVLAVDDLGLTKSLSDAYSELKFVYDSLGAVSYIKSCNMHLYKIVTDTSGFMAILKDDVELVKSNKLEDILANDEVLELDNNTKVITNLFNALERSDLTLDREGNTWYYEAFNGLNVLVFDALVVDTDGGTEKWET